MKQIIKEVIEAEEQVGEILKQARTKAAEIRSSAEKEISAKMSEAHQQARQLLQSAIEEAKKQAKDIKQQKLAQAHQDKDSVLNQNADKIDALVSSICDIILTTEHERDSE